MTNHIIFKDREQIVNHGGFWGPESGTCSEKKGKFPLWHFSYTEQTRRFCAGLL